MDVPCAWSNAPFALLVVLPGLGAPLQCPGSAPAPRQAAPGGSRRPGTPEGRDPATGRGTTASGARYSSKPASRSRRAHRRWPPRCVRERAHSRTRGWESLVVRHAMHSVSESLPELNVLSGALPPDALQATEVAQRGQRPQSCAAEAVAVCD